MANNLDSDVLLACKPTDLCFTCSRDFSDSANCICCFICESWFHTKCVGINKKQYDAITGLGTSIEWFCPSCRENKHTFAQKNVPGIVGLDRSTDVSVSDRLAKLENTVLSLVEVVKDVRNEKHSTHTEKIPLSYNQVLKIKSATNCTSHTEDGVNEKTVVNSLNKSKRRHPALFLLGCPADVISDRTTFLEKFSTLFPKCKIVGTYRKPSGTIVLYFDDVVNKDRVSKEWQSHYFGTSTRVVDPTNRPSNDRNLSVVVKNVPKHLSEASILNSISVDYHSCVSVTRFNKNNMILPIIKADFTAATDRDKIIHEGFFIENIFLKAELYTVLASPIRCFNCQRFGHISQNCKHSIRCVKCTGNHKHKDCSAAEVKCCGCGGKHLSSDRKCPSFLEVLQKLNVRK